MLNGSIVKSNCNLYEQIITFFIKLLFSYSKHKTITYLIFLVYINNNNNNIPVPNYRNHYYNNVNDYIYRTSSIEKKKTVYSHFRFSPKYKKAKTNIIIGSLKKI